MKKRRWIIGLLSYWFIGLLTLPAIWNLLRPGFYTSHDGEWMVIRLTAFHQSLKSGQLPIRWLSTLNHGYGYPVLNFLYPLPFYLAEPFYILTKNPVIAVKIIFIFSIFFAMVGQWILLKKLGNIAALTGSLIYIYAPYFTHNIYQRGSLGEVVAMGLVPWVFWALSKNKLLIYSLLLAALILSHNVVAALFLPIILIYLIYVIARSLRRGNLSSNILISYLLFLLLALGLSAFFWLPALAEYRFVRASIINVSDFNNEYLTLKQAFFRSGPITAIFSGGFSVIMLTNISQPFWNLFKNLQIIQFPWRLLSLFSFISSILFSYLIQYMRYRWKTISVIFSGILVTVTFIYTKSYLSPVSFNNHPPPYYQTNDDTTTSSAEYTPIWVKDLPAKAPESPQSHYYPGLKIFSSSTYIPNQNPDLSRGLLAPIQQFSPTEKVRIVWSETPLRTTANITSVFCALVLVYLTQYNRRYAT